MLSSESKSKRIRICFESLTERFVKLVHQIPVKKFEPPPPPFSILHPNYYWRDPCEEAYSLLHGVKRDYENWFEILKTVFSKAPEKIINKLNKADQKFRKWLELDKNWSLELDSNHNEQKFREDIYGFEELISILEASTNTDVIVIPDTNSIIAIPDPCAYRSLVNSESFTFLILSTILSELDNLKNNHRNPEFREKVKKSIKRIKGWQAQGDLNSGVTVDKTIKVKSKAPEPDMKSTLSWLDADNMDDRIIASILEIESNSPSTNVFLVTGDINLQNKANLAMIKVYDNPDA